MAKFYSSSSFEITVFSGENLKIDRRSIKKNAFVIVRSNGGNDFRTTQIDPHGGCYPKWDEKLVLDLPAHAPGITLEVYCKTSTGNRLVGAATVPVSDFSGGYVPENYLHYLSYRLRDHKGERNGIINISVRKKVPSSSSSAPAVGKSNLSGVVTGLPVWSS